MSSTDSRTSSKATVSRSRSRTPLWYVKFVFATYAAAVASSLVLFLLVVLMRGADIAGEWLLQPVAGVRLFGVLVLLLGVVWAPFVWRRLR